VHHANGVVWEAVCGTRLNFSFVATASAAPATFDGGGVSVNPAADVFVETPPTGTFTSNTVSGRRDFGEYSPASNASSPNASRIARASP